jgi:arylsulfatase A-like enzyme
MFDHQYSVYQPLLHVPLVIHYPRRFAPGRERRPVMSFDIFPTLLDLVGAEPPVGQEPQAVSLLAPLDDRTRFAEEPASAGVGIQMVRKQHPEWDPEPWQRRLRAWFEGPYKYIWGSDDRQELYDLDDDPMEQRDLAEDRPETLQAMGESLEAYYGTLNLCAPPSTAQPVPPEQLELLKGLGYVGE